MYNNDFHFSCLSSEEHHGKKSAYFVQWFFFILCSYRMQLLWWNLYFSCLCVLCVYAMGTHIAGSIASQKRRQHCVYCNDDITICEHTVAPVTHIRTTQSTVRQQVPSACLRVWQSWAPLPFATITEVRFPLFPRFYTQLYHVIVIFILIFCITVPGRFTEPGFLVCHVLLLAQKCFMLDYGANYCGGNWTKQSQHILSESLCIVWYVCSTSRHHAETSAFETWILVPTKMLFFGDINAIILKCMAAAGKPASVPQPIASMRDSWHDLPSAGERREMLENTSMFCGHAREERTGYVQIRIFCQHLWTTVFLSTFLLFWRWILKISTIPAVRRAFLCLSLVEYLFDLSISEVSLAFVRPQIAYPHSQSSIRENNE